MRRDMRRSGEDERWRASCREISIERKNRTSGSTILYLTLTASPLYSKEEEHSDTQRDYIFDRINGQTLMVVHLPDVTLCGPTTTVRWLTLPEPPSPHRHLTSNTLQKPTTVTTYKTNWGEFTYASKRHCNILKGKANGKPRKR